MNVIYFGNSSSVFSNRHFRALQNTNVSIVAVVDAPPTKRISTNRAADDVASDFVTLARRAEIPIFEPSRPNQPAFIEALRATLPDLFIAAGYTQILGSTLLRLPATAAVNFHASLLPAYRGKHPLFWALRNGERWAGLTVHMMDAGIDTGDILYQVRLRTRKRDSVASLYDRVMAQSEKLIANLVSDAESGRLHPRPQPESGASYYSSVTSDDFRIDWRRPAAEISRWINISPGQCFSQFSGQPVRFWNSKAMTTPPTAAPGTLLSLGRTRSVVAASDGGVSLGRIKGDDGVTENAADWCRKHDLRPGDLLIGE
ncbi:MAG: methionyl-tRNA formyltransferase [Caldilineales bacterium]|nr:methionyl-tRNA formyltransferase [Caldilineales bacterium]